MYRVLKTCDQSAKLSIVGSGMAVGLRHTCGLLSPNIFQSTVCHGVPVQNLIPCSTLILILLPAWIDTNSSPGC